MSVAEAKKLQVSMSGLLYLLTGASLCFCASRLVGWGVLVPLSYFGLAYGLSRLAGKFKVPQDLG